MIRIATIGTSWIADKMVRAMSEDGRAVFVGTLSRSPERAASFTARHGGTLPFTSIDALAASDAVDAVYIASPNALHAGQALACIRGGKHIMAEKPFCANRREAAEVFDAAREAGVVALEAMKTVHDPAFRACQDALPELGRIRSATFRYGGHDPHYDTLLAGGHANVFDAHMATGSLMDIGVYSVASMVELFGEPDTVTSFPVMLDERTRALTNGPIDGAGVVVAGYPGMVATVHHSKISDEPAPSTIEGELGSLTIERLSHPAAAHLRLYAGTASGTGTSARPATVIDEQDLCLPSRENTMSYELEDFVSAIEEVEGGAAPEQAHAGSFNTVGGYQASTLATLAVMDEARRQTGIVFPADER